MKKLLSIYLIILIFFCWQINLICAINPVIAQNSIQQYSKIAHDAYDNKDLLKAGQYYEKAYALNKNKVFIDNAITAYLSYAFEQSNEKKYDEAIKYCQKVLTIKPNEQNAKELLSDIYYTVGSDSFYSGQSDKAKEYFNNALKYSVEPEQSQRANEALSELSKAGKHAEKYQFRPITNPAPNSIPEIINLLEMKIYGKNNTNLPIMARIQKLEKDVFNQNYENESLISRTDRLKKTVLPELAQLQTGSYSDGKDYVKDIIDQSGGTAKMFGEMPVRVFIDESNVKNYHGYYIDAVKDAFKEWQNASDNKIKFEITGDPQRANIKVTWVEYFEDFHWQPDLTKEDLADRKEKIRYEKAGSLVQIGSIAAMVLGGVTGVPAIGMLGSVGGSVVSPMLQYRSLSLDDKLLKVSINTDCTAGMTKEQAKEKIKQIAMHQLGHAIGIYGHSPNPDDIMYANFKVEKISERDKNTIKEIYKNVK